MGGPRAELPHRPASGRSSGHRLMPSTIAARPDRQRPGAHPAIGKKPPKPPPPTPNPDDLAAGCPAYRVWRGRCGVAGGGRGGRRREGGGWVDGASRRPAPRLSAPPPLTCPAERPSVRGVRARWRGQPGRDRMAESPNSPRPLTCPAERPGVRARWRAGRPDGPDRRVRGATGPRRARSGRAGWPDSPSFPHPHLPQPDGRAGALAGRAAGRTVAVVGSTRLGRPLRRRGCSGSGRGWGRARLAWGSPGGWAGHPPATVRGAGG